MSALDDLFDMTNYLEQILEKKYGATGRGLYEKALSVSDKISQSCLKKIRQIAGIRNKAAHVDRKIAAKQIHRVRELYREVIRELDPPKFSWGMFFTVIVVLAAIAYACVKYIRF